MNSIRHFLSSVSHWGASLVNIIFPDVCTVCHRTLVQGEKHICLGCLMDLPRTNFHLTASNALTERLFSIGLPLERAASMFYYMRGNPYTALIHDTKYHGRPVVGRHMAAMYARELLPTGFFDDIDLIVPVPLHFLKQLGRGYNQAEEIADSIGETTGLPVISALKANYHRSQTRKDAHARLRNALGTYSVRDVEALRDRHILLVDDVITTGSTILACMQAIKDTSPTTRISVYSLAATRLG